jgi:hypothetical protein
MTCTHAATEIADACIEHCPICQCAEIARLTAVLEDIQVNTQETTTEAKCARALRGHRVENRK